MKKRVCITLAGLCLCLTACTRTDEKTDSSAEIIEGEMGEDELIAGEAVEEEEKTDNEKAGEAQSIEEIHRIEELEETENVSDVGTPDGIEWSVVENPSWEYYCISESIPEDDYFLSLEVLTEEANEIIDTDTWFAENGLGVFEQGYINIIEDDTYRYEIMGDDGYSGYYLNIYDKVSGAYLWCLDFSNYRYADDFKEEDRDFIEQRIWWVESVGDILYVSIGHNTYTESCPHTGYLVAIDLKDMSVLWKSAPCMTNARTFEIIDNTIVCGYGFTSEPDYLNLVNKENGELLEQIPLKSMAEYIIAKDDVLYVRTYNTNYEFQIYRGILCH